MASIKDRESVDYHDARLHLWGRRRSGESGRRTSGRREAWTGFAFTLPFVAGFLLVFIIPICVALQKSVTRQVASGGGVYGGGDLTEVFVGLQNFREVLASERFWSGTLRVGVFGAVQIPVMILAALALALLLDSALVRNPTFFRLSFFLPYAIPGVVAAMVWLYLYTPEISPIVKGLAGIGVHVDFMGRNMVLFSMANMTTWTYTGYNMLIFLAALQSVPKELYDAARIDGAGEWKVATRIKIPMIRGAALLAVLLSIIGTVQLFNEPVVLATMNPWMGNDFTPMMMAYSTAMGGLSPSGDGPASAISIVMAVIAGTLALLYSVVQRRVAQ